MNDTTETENTVKQEVLTGTIVQAPVQTAARYVLLVEFDDEEGRSFWLVDNVLHVSQADAVDELRHYSNVGRHLIVRVDDLPIGAPE